MDRWFLVKEGAKLKVWHQVVGLYTFVFLVWSVYRLLVGFPTWFEEIFLKGLVFGAPVLWLVLRSDKLELKDLGLNGDKMFQNGLFGIGLGLLLGILAVLTSYLKNGSLVLGIEPHEMSQLVFLAIVTAFWEQLLFTGFILKRLQEVIIPEWKLVLTTALLYVLLFIPKMILGEWSLAAGAGNIMLLFTLIAGSSILRLRLGNLLSPILTHAIWGVMIVLFA